MNDVGVAIIVKVEFWNLANIYARGWRVRSLARPAALRA
jgi:hypothetical protein